MKILQKVNLISRVKNHSFMIMSKIFFQQILGKHYIWNIILSDIIEKYIFGNTTKLFLLQVFLLGTKKVKFVAPLVKLLLN
jgi:hypothetical protein